MTSTANLQDKITLCYSYARVSGITQSDSEKDGLPRQFRAINDFCAKMALTVVQAFDDAYTGKEMDRPAFVEMRALMIENGVKIVVIEKLDRLARDLMVQETILSDFKKNGITLLSTMEPDLCSDDPSRKFFRQIMGALAEYDRAMLVSRMKAGKARARANGKRCGGRASYGNHKAHPEERAVIDRVNHLQRHGFNASKIADLLNSEGLLTRKGTRFRAMQVSRILSRTRENTKGIL